MRWSEVIASAASFNQMNKKGTNVRIMNYKKHDTLTKMFFPVNIRIMQKNDLQTGHLSEDRSFA